MSHPYTNHLIHETSPYLLQHAHNPVDWHAWNEASLQLAKEQHKLIIISVGYAACHWCHVMEHESFEDIEVARTMNESYISIKVDREERPDIDHVYMSAVQLMTGAGGWPMNVVALPDGRPVWGGTYFKKEQWMTALHQISKLYETNSEKLIDYANNLEIGMRNLDSIVDNEEMPSFSIEFIKNAVDNWSQQFDYKYGGMSRAPKFMMPTNYHFLLRMAHQTNDDSLFDYLNLTLTKMAHGGIFDQLGGGFSRYSVDDKWHVPHFEKMLYDNGQLVSLYADAYLITKNQLYKDIVRETLQFVKRELTGAEGNFYSSLDADSTNSEGMLEEGAFYVWTKEELKEILRGDFDLFSDYYNVNAFGLWEQQKYVLIRKDTDNVIIQKHNITPEYLSEKKQVWRKLLLIERNKRERPRLDDKTLTSWNALMLKGFVDAYRVFGDNSYLEMALKNAEFILNRQLTVDGALYHNFKDGKSTINGFLEDYATTIEAFIVLYEQTLDSKWLLTSRDFANYALDHFFDAKLNLFYFNSNIDRSLVSRPIEYRDNVIAASNSIMAKNLFKLSHHFENDHYYETATSMLKTISPEIVRYPSAFSNWLDLMLNYTQPFFELAIVGEDAHTKIAELNRTYIPNMVIAGSTTQESLPLIKNRYVDAKTLIYVCANKVCQSPLSSVHKAIEQLKL